MADSNPLDSLSKGELRRLYLHLKEAQDRLDRARTILDENNLLEEWDGKRGFLFGFTDGHTRIDNCYTDVSQKYANRKQIDD